MKIHPYTQFTIPIPKNWIIWTYYSLDEFIFYTQRKYPCIETDPKLVDLHPTRHGFMVEKPIIMETLSLPSFPKGTIGIFIKHKTYIK